MPKGTLLEHSALEWRSKPTLSQASHCFYPFEVRKLEETGFTQNLMKMMDVAQPTALQISLNKVPRASAQEDATPLVEWARNLSGSEFLRLCVLSMYSCRVQTGQGKARAGSVSYRAGQGLLVHHLVGVVGTFGT